MPRGRASLWLPEKSDVDDFGDVASNERMAEYARSIVRHFDIEPLFGDVEDLVDKKPKSSGRIPRTRE
jgi:hypothetical protein